MKELVLNAQNLLEEEIDEEVTRVKALMINSDNKILLGYSYDTYQFPGGHLEKDEDPIEGLIREIKEETGIEINKDIIHPFMMLRHLSRNYFNKGKNRCNKIIYYIIKTDEKINMDNTNYTDYEKEGDFRLMYLNLDEVEETLIDHSNKYPDYKSIAYEMLQVLFEYNNSTFNE